MQESLTQPYNLYYIKLPFDSFKDIKRLNSVHKKICYFWTYFDEQLILFIAVASSL